MSASRDKYDAKHNAARKAAYARLPEWPMCVRGGHTMWKHAKDAHGRSALHYDHSDDNTGYVGFSCALHNTRHGAQITNARRSGRVTTTTTAPATTYYWDDPNRPDGRPSSFWDVMWDKDGNHIPLPPRAGR